MKADATSTGLGERALSCRKETEGVRGGELYSAGAATGFLLRNEVFLRTPVRLLRGEPDPRPSPTTPSTTPSTSTVLQPTRRCRVVLQDRVLSPQVQDRGPCEAPDEAGPRWLRFDVGDGCAEVWIDGALAADFAEVGAGAMSPPAGGQRIHVDAGRRAVDVLVWPAPIARPDATAFPDPGVTLVDAP